MKISLIHRCYIHVEMAPLNIKESFTIETFKTVWCMGNVYQLSDCMLCDSYYITLILFQIDGNMAVDAIDFFVTDIFGERLYDSCKDVKFGTMNTRAIDFIGAGAKSYRGII